MYPEVPKLKNTIRSSVWSWFVDLMYEAQSV